MKWLSAHHASLQASSWRPRDQSAWLAGSCTPKCCSSTSPVGELVRRAKELVSSILHCAIGPPTTCHCLFGFDVGASPTPALPGCARPRVFLIYAGMPVEQHQRAPAPCWAWSIVWPAGMLGQHSRQRPSLALPTPKGGLIERSGGPWCERETLLGANEDPGKIIFRLLLWSRAQTGCSFML